MRPRDTCFEGAALVASHAENEFELCLLLHKTTVGHSIARVPQRPVDACRLRTRKTSSPITIIREQKIRKFVIWQRREKFEHGCTTTNHPLYKACKTFLRACLNSVSLITNGDTAVRFFAPPVRT